LTSSHLGAFYLNEFEEKILKGRAPEEVYLSHWPQKGCPAETLVDHLRYTLGYARGLHDHVKVVARLARKLDESLEPDRALCVARFLLEFTATYHDIGKADARYQLYTRELLGGGERLLPHNYASVAFIVSDRGILDGFLDILVSRYGIDVKVAEWMYNASLTAILMHHEYYDYRNLSFIEVLTPLTLALAKDVDLNDELAFHRSAFYLLNNLDVQPKPTIRNDLIVPLGVAVEYAITLHYELGALPLALAGEEQRVSMGELQDDVKWVLALAEALTWALTVADNLAASRRCEGRERGSFGAKIVEYYGVTRP